MATTTNYGWTTPDDTALVKDGAAAIRTLGSSVDTTTKNLNPSTTLGDIEYRSSTANVNTRLPLGTANQQLRVNSGATAPEWFTPAVAGGMTLINTGGTSLSGSSVSLTSIPATFKALKLYIRNFQPSTTANLLVRFNSDSTANRHSTPFAWYYTDQANLPFDSTSMKTTVAATYQNTSSSEFIGIVEIEDYANTTTWKPYYTYSYHNDASTATKWGSWTQLGVYNQTSAISSLDILVSTGTFSGGTVFLYGIG